jgi:hypothetical protein
MMQLVPNYILIIIKSVINFSAYFSVVVGIATAYGLDDKGVGVRVPVGSRIFSSPIRSDRLWGPILLYNGYRCLFPGGKAAGV